MRVVGFALLAACMATGAAAQQQLTPAPRLPAKPLVTQDAKDARDARSSQPLGDAKAAKLETDNAALEKQMAEAREKADRQMEAAAIAAALGVASVALQIGNGAAGTSGQAAADAKGAQPPQATPSVKPPVTLKAAAPLKPDDKKSSGQ